MKKNIYFMLHLFSSILPLQAKSRFENFISTLHDLWMNFFSKKMTILSTKVVSLPSNIMLEVSALCNLSCLGCALHGPKAFVDRPFGNMKKDVWESVITEIGSWNHKVSLTTHGGGEPLMHPHLREILTMAKSFDNIEVGFLTNGMLLDESWARSIIDLRLDWIAFSIDGTNPQTHDQIRQHSNLRRVERNLETLLSLKKKEQSRIPRVKLNMVAYDTIMDQQHAFVEKWIDRVDAVMISNYRTPPESKRLPNTPLKRKPCRLLWTDAVIAWDGRLALCCEDFNINYSQGRIERGSTIASIWRSKYLSSIRNLHQKGEYAAHPMCSICDTWADAYVKKIRFHPKFYQVIQIPSQTIYSR